jgi:hypothetical protein
VRRLKREDGLYVEKAIKANRENEVSRKEEVSREDQMSKGDKAYRGGGGLSMQIEPWYLGPVPTYRVNKHKDRRGIRHQTADSRQLS